MANKEPDRISIPDAVRQEVFSFMDAVFAADVRDAKSHAEWVELRKNGYLSFVATACMLQFAATLYALFDFFKVRIEEYQHLISVILVFIVVGFGITLWNHYMVFRLFMFRAAQSQKH